LLPANNLAFSAGYNKERLKTPVNNKRELISFLEVGRAVVRKATEIFREIQNKHLKSLKIL
jgi:hypothetical protein